jgi:penicillin-binding protein 1A
VSPGKKVVLALAILMVVGVVGAVGSVVGVFWYYGRGVSSLDEDRLENYRPSQVTRIYARDGQTLIGESFTQRRTFIPYGEIPSHVENAFLAAEDADFYKHEGMDYVGMVRALIVNVKAGEIKQGASTITQQVVKIFMLSPDRTFERKVQELILARRLEQALSKQKILELYLNEIYLGHGRYGVEEASQFYFGKSVREIDMGQGALLATLPKAPGRDSPHKTPDKAKTRQVYVLQQMVKHGFATQADASKFIDAPLDFVKDAPTDSRVVTGAEEFADEAVRQLKARYGPDLDTLGARVTTSVDMKIQRAARADLIVALDELDERQGYARFATVASKKRLSSARREVEGGVRPGRVLRAVVVATPDGITLPDGSIAATYGDTPVLLRIPADDRLRDPARSLGEQFPVGAVTPASVLRMSGGEGVPEGWAEARLVAPQAAVMVADAESGEVLAMVGGYAYARGEFNRALQAERQPGSSFKPFVYGAALATKRYSPATLVDDSPAIYEKWKPTNYLRDVYQGKVRLRDALRKSINTIAIKLIDDVGFAGVHQFAEAAGIPGPLPEHLSLALGTKELRPSDMLQGYLTLARGGRRVAPVIVRRIEIPGEAVWEPERAETQALPQDVVFVLTSMMQSVVEAGTGTKAKALGRPVAGKTGTSDSAYDAWFCGFTPEHVAVAWVGFDQPRALGSGETGGKAAIPVWLGAMRAAETGPIVDFLPPPSVIVRRIDAESGLLAPTVPELDPETGKPAEFQTLDEYFVAGTEPIDEATPAALPADDVLLGLYGDEGEEGLELPDDGAVDDETQAVTEDAPGLDDVPPSRLPGLERTRPLPLPPPPG